MLHGLNLVIESSEILQCLLCLGDPSVLVATTGRKQKTMGESDSYGSIGKIPDLASRPQRGEHGEKNEQRSDGATYGARK